jgi:hypothetical protein
VCLPIRKAPLNVELDTVLRVESEIKETREGG